MASDTAGFAAKLLSTDGRAAVRAAALAAILVVVLGVPLAALLNIWIDESFTLHTTGSGPGYAWAQSVNFEVQPPLYFVALAVWRLMNEGSITIARLPSVAYVAGAAALIVAAMHRIAPRVPPYIVAFITALNPFVIWAAVEMRVYGLVFLIGAALTWAFFEAFLTSRPGWRACTIYAMVAVAGLYTQYYVGFLIFAQGLTLLVIRREALRAFIGSGLIVTALFAPFVPIVLVHAHAIGSFVRQPSLSHSLHSMLNAVFVYVLPHDLNWTGIAKYAGFGLAVLLTLLLSYGRPAALSCAAGGVILQWSIAIGVFTVMLTLSGAPDDVTIHASVLAPSTLIAAFVLFSSVARAQRSIVAVAVVGYVLFAAATFWAKYHPPIAKQGDWKRVAAAISSDDLDTPVAVMPAEAVLPLRWYLPTATVPIPGPMPFRPDYTRTTALTGQPEVARVLDPIRARSERLWLVTTECEDSVLLSYNYHCNFLEHYLAGRYRTRKTLQFNGSRVRLLERIGDAAR